MITMRQGVLLGVLGVVALGTLTVVFESPLMEEQYLGEAGDTNQA